MRRERGARGRLGLDPQPSRVALAALLIAALSRFRPSERQPTRSVLPGAILAAVVWACAPAIFSRAAAGVLQFGVTDGSFSAAIVLLVSLYFAAAGLLLGAQFNAALRRSHMAAAAGKPSADNAEVPMAAKYRQR